MKAKIYIGAKKYALYIGRKIVQKTLEFLTIPARFVSKKVQDLKNYLIYGNSQQDGTPTPTAPIEVESVGDRTKNLLDLSKITTTTRDGITVEYKNNKIHIFGSPTIKSGYISLLFYDVFKTDDALKTYTMSRDKVINGIGFTPSNVLDVDGKSSGTLNFSMADVVKERTSTVSFDQKNMYLNIRYDIGTIDEYFGFQLEEGSVATPYELYGYKIPVTVGGTTTNIYLDQPLRKIGDYADYIDFENQKVVRNVGSLLLNTVNFSYISGLKSFNSNVIANTVANMPNVYCEAYKWSDMISTVWANANKVIGVNVTSTGTTRTGNFGLKTLAIKDTDFTTQTELKNAIGNAKVYYVLATPTEETIDLPVINLPQGTLMIDTSTNIKPSKMIITGDIDNE